MVLVLPAVLSYLFTASGRGTPQIEVNYVFNSAREICVFHVVLSNTACGGCYVHFMLVIRSSKVLSYFLLRNI
jgi:hypothetical protein